MSMFFLLGRAIAVLMWAYTVTVVVYGIAYFVWGPGDITPPLVIAIVCAAGFVPLGLMMWRLADE